MLMLTDIKAKIEKLIEAYEAAKAENEVLAEKLRQSEEKNEDQKKQITELEKQIDNLRLAEAFTGAAEDRDVAKRKIDRLIREIDKCISLMEG